MLFHVIETAPKVCDVERVYLEIDKWDDWGKFRTQFTLVVFDGLGHRYYPGPVKIGSKGLKAARSSEIAPGFRAPSLPEVFDVLDDTFFSLGQNENYYETLQQMPESLRLSIVKGLRDCAYNLEIFEENKNEYVMTESLLRSVPAANVRHRLHRLATGEVELTEFDFSFTLARSGDSETPPTLDFHVVPKSVPPTNLHVLIGRNGVGKTRTLKSLATAILSDKPSNEDGVVLNVESDEWAFAGLVTVSFSAFDRIKLPSPTRVGLKSSFVGFPVGKTTEQGGEKSSDTVERTELSFSNDFVQSLANCSDSPRRKRFRDAIATLESDPLLREAEVNRLLETDDVDQDDAKSFFDRLSSGHKIVLLTITRLVELVDERTIVLLDEPEGHLHPPLLSAFIRALSDLMIKRNGVAIIATHSPVVLQEVPRSCVWILRRFGGTSIAERPAIETFGENVGVLTHEVFQLEVTDSGFHKMLEDAVQECGLYEEVLERFKNQLGSEAKAIVRSLIATKQQKGGKA